MRESPLIPLQAVHLALTHTLQWAMPFTYGKNSIRKRLTLVSLRLVCFAWHNDLEFHPFLPNNSILFFSVAGYPTVYIHTPFSLSGHALCHLSWFYNFSVVSSDVINIWGVIWVLSALPPDTNPGGVVALIQCYFDVVEPLGVRCLKEEIWTFEAYLLICLELQPLLVTLFASQLPWNVEAFLSCPLVMIHSASGVPKQKIQEIILKPMKLWATFKLPLFKVHYLNTFITVMKLRLTELLSQQVHEQK